MEVLRMSRLVDLVGRRFGRLAVVGRDDIGGPKVKWLCRCDCGTTRSVLASNLTCGRTSSCGCLNRELRFARGTHRATDSPEYIAWLAMKARCLRPTMDAYPNYGGRGITICPQWLESFEQFLGDMGAKPPNPPDWTSRKSYWTLDRIDNDGDYEPSNCRWATPTEQVANRRKTSHCNQGHLFDVANTYTDATGRRHCRECGRLRAARRRAA